MTQRSSYLGRERLLYEVYCLNCKFSVKVAWMRGLSWEERIAREAGLIHRCEAPDFRVAGTR